MPAKATMNNYVALKLFALLNIKAKLRVNKQIPNADANIVYVLDIANSPIIISLEANLMRGTSAKGSYTDYRILRAVSILVNDFWFKKVTMTAGTIAMDLVTNTLYHTGNLMFRKPSITNYPEYVPVIVEL